MEPIDARAVANYLLAKAEVDQKPLSHLQLQKLTYLAHGWMLGLSGRPLIGQPVHAWPYGPVIPAVYQAFKQAGNGRITGRATYYDPNAGWRPFEPAMDEYAKAVVDSVWAVYGGMSGGQLITLTHQPGTPWEQVTRGKRPDEVRDVPIPDEIIRRYYHDLAVKNKASQHASGDSV